MRGPENAPKTVEEPQGAHHSLVRRPNVHVSGDHMAVSWIQSCPFINPQDLERYIPMNINSVLTNETEYLCSLWLCLRSRPNNYPEHPIIKTNSIVPNKDCRCSSSKAILFIRSLCI